MGYLSLLLGVVFAASALAKLAEPKAFEDYLWPLARARSKPLARAAVTVEAALAVVLAIAAIEASARTWAAIASAGFLLVATCWHAVVLARTDLADCRCFGRLAEPAARVDRAWQPALLALRNAALLALSVAIGGGTPALALAAVASVALAIAVGLALSARRYRATLASERHPDVDSYAPTMRVLAAHTWWLEGRPRPF